MLEVVNVHVCAKFHQPKCNSLLIIVVTKKQREPNLAAICEKYRCRFSGQ